MTAVGAACVRCATPLESGDLRCAVCALPAPSVADGAGSAPIARILRCRECNAAVAFSPEAQAPRCAFCGSVMAVEQPVDPVEEARVRLPFTVDRAEAEATLRHWLSRRGFFAPAQLANAAVVDALAPLYWAAWIVDARIQVTWTADSDAGSGRSNWAPHGGEYSTECANLVIPASRGLTRAECAELVPFYDLGKLAPLPPGTSSVDDASIEGFDAQRSAARAHVHEALESLACVRAERHIPGTRFRNVHASCLVERQTTERGAFPAWVLVYRYKGKPYRAVIHGQRPGVAVGAAPLSVAKVAAVVLAVAAGLAAIVALLLLLRRH